MADFIPVNVITKADGNPFDNTGQVLAMPTQERDLANIYLVQNGSAIDRYFFKDGLANDNLEIWQTESSSPAYSSYIAIISQNSTNNPTATVLNSDDDNYLGDITWARDGEGEYSASKTGAFTENKTWIMFSQAAPTPPAVINAYRVNANAISFTLINTVTELPQDGFIQMAVEIRVYP